jgi:hypothetical protein
MDISPSTRQLVTSLDRLSGGTLSRRDDLASLIELAAKRNGLDQLDTLSFHAKFVTKSCGIMKRIGKDADGYEKLLRECTASVDLSKELLHTLLTSASDEVRHHFAALYLPLTTAGFENLLALLHDLSWYKNWLIDGARERL